MARPMIITLGREYGSGGRKIAEKMYERHTFISDWLISLGVNPAVAVDDACRMEHVISEESFTAIKNHVHLKKESK